MEKETVDLKVKETDRCTKCSGDLKVYALGAGDLFSFTSTKGALYCENQDCDFFGVLTLARTRKAEKV